MNAHVNAVATHTKYGFLYAFASGLGIDGNTLPETIEYKGRTYLPEVDIKIFQGPWSDGLLNYIQYAAPHGFHGNVFFRLYRG